MEEIDLELENQKLKEEIENLKAEIAKLNIRVEQLQKAAFSYRRGLPWR